MPISGECVWQGRNLRVSVSELNAEGCDLAFEPDSLAGDGELALWLGAVGPLPAHATRRDAEHMTARFSEPLDERILNHFAAA